MKIDKEIVVDGFALVLIFLFLLSYFNPELLLSKTTIAGGDTVSHFALAYYLKNYLLPHGELIGWYPHWFAGVPMFQFYFVLPYLLMTVISYLIPLEVSFKLVSILGIFMLPLTTYLSMKLMGFKFPVPIVAAALSLMFLFLETNSYYGGNIPSTLAGEISYSISFALMVLSVGLIYKGIESKKLLIENSIVLSLVLLTHIYTAMLLCLSSLFFVLKKRMHALIYLAFIGIVAFSLAAFWALPFVLKYGYSSAPKELLQNVDISLAIIPHFIIFYILAIASSAIGIKTRDEKILYLLFIILVSIILFMFANKFVHLLYIRFLPFLYFFPLLLAADMIGKISEIIKLKTVVPILVLLIIMVWLAKTISFIPFWIKWNYSGLEGKETWNEFNSILKNMTQLSGTGRIIVEYSAAYDKYGSPRVFEVSPVFTNKSVMEGLLLESSLTFPYYYYIQKEIAADSWWPGFSIKYPDFNLTAGAEHLRLYNIQYYLVSSDTVKNAIVNNTNYEFVKQVGTFDIYKVEGDFGYAEVSKREPVLVVASDWRQISYDWFSSNNLDVPLVFVSSVDDYDLEHFRIIVRNTDDLQNAINNSTEISNSCNVNSVLSEEEINITTSCIGKPIIIKTSYFPNWQVDGAKKIYLVSPDLMMIFPEKNNVRLYYENTVIDSFGILLTVLGIVFVVATYRYSSAILKIILKNSRRILNFDFLWS